MASRKKIRTAKEAAMKAQLGIQNPERLSWTGFRPTVMRSGNTYNRQKAKADARKCLD